MRDIKHSKKKKENVLDLRNRAQGSISQKSVSQKEEPQITVFKKEKKKGPSFIIVLFLIFLLAILGGFSSYYFFYMKKNATYESEKQEETGDRELREIEDMLNQLEEDTEKIDDTSDDEEVPQVDLNVTL